jgi:hypothetical protein
LSKLNLKVLLAPCAANVYPHLDIAVALLAKGYLRIFQPYFVIKDKEIREGGDSYSHRLPGTVEIQGNLNLNPSIYGRRARAQQFYYCENNLSIIAQEIGCLASLLSKANAFVFFSYAISRSEVVTVIDERTSLLSETAMAIEDAKISKYFSGTLTASLFGPFVNSPILFRRVFLKSLLYCTSIINRLAVIFFALNSEKYN